MDHLSTLSYITVTTFYNKNSPVFGPPSTCAQTVQFLLHFLFQWWWFWLKMAQYQRAISLSHCRSMLAASQ